MEDNQCPKNYAEQKPGAVVGANAHQVLEEHAAASTVEPVR